MKSELEKTVRLVADYFDRCKVGCTGTKGYRKTTDLSKLAACIEDLESRRLLDPERTVFTDLGCGDGRVNFLMSYFVRRSIGIEIDSEILSEYEQRTQELFAILERDGGLIPPANTFLFRGSSLENATFAEIRSRAGVDIENIDIFYTYITLHDVFAEKIAECGRPGAYYMVYGFNRILPRYDGFDLIVPDLGSQGIAALFRKKS